MTSFIIILFLKGISKNKKKNEYLYRFDLEIMWNMWNCLAGTILNLQYLRYVSK